MRSTSVSRKCAAASDVARSCTSTTSQRETMSRAEKCFSTTPRAGRSSLVSSWTRIPRLLNGPKTGLSRGPGAAAKFPASSSVGRLRRRFDQHPAPLQIPQDAAHHGGGKREVVAAEQHHQFVLAPARILASQGQDGFGLRGCPGGLSKPVRTMRVALEAGEVVGIIAAPPAIEGLATDPEMAAGEGRIAPVLEIVGYPLKPPSRVAT
jgi:hypothetical protein